MTNLNSSFSVGMGIITWSLRFGCFLHLFMDEIYEFTETSGESMTPTLQPNGDYAHVLKRYKYGKDLKVGDVIVAVKPTEPHHRVCKRITGLPGDMILIDPSMGSDLNSFDKIGYNGNDKDKDKDKKIGGDKEFDEKLNEYIEYIEKTDKQDIQDKETFKKLELKEYNENKYNSMNRYIIVPEGHCWLTGDNLSQSLDSRSYRPVPMGLIKGKIIAANLIFEPFIKIDEDDKLNVYGFRWIKNNFEDEIYSIE
ncbi:endopeptidase catalytic subunit IMP1 [Ascoidea rubescens DSM 1968]|uniref:Mitochondrial inner membrane protease subunit n=1 Tax=Ascoidea rubescens DSM 1968 TaxID=1344418 RepID=A0A1D2VRM2_9ASCO|nr:LexA/Signal peptidase [Ascoidea rubescens DSM 1968]ODV64217.1 LexA/Signal peptidase [Ascoidea rubescens DSM 1968]